jgi:hypothetical protein
LGDLTFRGEVAAETRFFPQDDVQATEDINAGLFARMEVMANSGPWKAALRGVARGDFLDRDRDGLDAEEAWFGYQTPSWSLRAGLQYMNWSATEAFHPADSINSRNLDSRLENPEKRGEPMLSWQWKHGRGDLAAFWMPFFIENRAPSPSSRLNFLAGQPWLEARVLGALGQPRHGERIDQWGLRYTTNIGDGDLALHYLDHVERQQFRLQMEPDGVRPLHAVARELGLTHQHVFGSYVFKVEAAHKDFQTPAASFLPEQTHLALGLEYGWVTSRGASATLLVEGMRVLGIDRNQRAISSLFQNDALLGYRHAWNDVWSRELLLTLVGDLERSEELLLHVQYSQRLSDTTSLAIGARVIHAKPIAPGSSPGLQALREADQVFLSFSRHF